MDDILAEIDRIIAECSKRDLVPSNEVVNELLDLRNYVALRAQVPSPATV